MLLMITDKLSEFDRICVDQGLNLVFEGRAILHGMPSNSSMVFTHGIDIVSDKGQICIEFNPIYLVFCVVYHLFWTF